MRETRRSLKAVNAELSSKLAVHTHETRKSLNGMLGMIRARNEDLVTTVKKQEIKIAELQEKLTSAAEVMDEMLSSIPVKAAV